MMEIGKNLKELRKVKGLSLRALAEQVGVSRNTLSSYELYSIVPTITNAVKICEFFQVPVEYLLYGKNSVSDFGDGELLKLFRKVDGYGNEDKDLAKRFLRKLVDNVEGRERLEGEVGEFNK